MGTWKDPVVWLFLGSVGTLAALYGISHFMKWISDEGMLRDDGPATGDGSSSDRRDTF